MKKFLLLVLLIFPLSAHAADTCGDALVPAFTAQQAKLLCGGTRDLSLDDLTVGDDLTVTGLVTVGETLAVTGDATFSGIIQDVSTIAAAGSSNSDATAVTSHITYVTGSNQAKGVILPAASVGEQYLIHNTVAAAGSGLYVYPPASDSINGLTVTTAGELVHPQSDCLFTKVAALTWFASCDVDPEFANNINVNRDVTAGREITSANTATIGWTVQTGANTACTTTCTYACVFGWDTSGTQSTNVDCADATADECLCAGAS